MGERLFWKMLRKRWTSSPYQYSMVSIACVKVAPRCCFIGWSQSLDAAELVMRFRTRFWGMRGYAGILRKIIDRTWTDVPHNFWRWLWTISGWPYTLDMGLFVQCLPKAQISKELTQWESPSSWLSAIQNWKKDCGSQNQHRYPIQCKILHRCRFTCASWEATGEIAHWWSVSGVTTAIACRISVCPCIIGRILTSTTELWRIKPVRHFTSKLWRIKPRRLSAKLGWIKIGELSIIAVGRRIRDSFVFIIALWCTRLICCIFGRSLCIEARSAAVYVMSAE